MQVRGLRNVECLLYLCAREVTLGLWFIIAVAFAVVS